MYKKQIRTVTRIIPKIKNGKTVLYLHAHSGRTWLSKRQINLLRNHGFTIIALDFNFSIKNHRVKDLTELMDEVDSFLQNEKLIREELIIIGLSLGGLVGYNMLRRHALLKKLIVITGGNIALLPSKNDLKNNWKMTRAQLEEEWKEVNMFTPLGALVDKNIMMLLPLRDRVINPNEVLDEIEKQTKFNNMIIVRTKGGHFRTVFTQIIFQPKKILSYIKTIETRITK